MKINFRQYSLMSLSVFIAFSGISHAATTYMEARNDAMGEPVLPHPITVLRRLLTRRC